VRTSDGIKKELGVKYRVVFAYDDNVWLTRYAIAESEQAIFTWYRLHDPDARILGIYPPIIDMEPNMPCIEIPWKSCIEMKGEEK